MTRYRDVFTLQSSAVTHTGMVRELNEDAFLSRDDIGLWAVADGMGGHQAGEVASAKVMESLRRLTAMNDIRRQYEDLRTALSSANSELLELGRSYHTERVPGSTVVALLIVGDQAVVCWAGDSRLYRMRDDELEQITRDHSQVQELLDEHLITAAEAEVHPQANVITRAVGIEDPLELDSVWLDVRDGDRFLLCSDGLTRSVDAAEMREMLRAGDIEDAVKSLLHTALIRGAPDNVTLICVKAGSGVPAGD